MIDIGTNEIPFAARAVLDTLPNGVLVAEVRDAQRPVVYANTALVRLLGLEPAMLLQREALWMLAADADPAIAGALQAALSSCESFTGELTVLHGSGERRLCRIHLQPLPTPADSVTHLSLTFEDIGAFKRTRDQLRSSEARLELAMQASELAMWDWNVAQDEVYYNDQWRNCFGIEPRGLLALDNLGERLLLPIGKPAVLDAFEQHLQGACAGFESEYELRVAGGKSYWVAVHAKVVQRDAHGRPLRVIGVMRDVSPRKQMLLEARGVQQRWERAVRGTCDGLYDWDLATGHVWYAARFREIVDCVDREFPDTFQAFQNIILDADRAFVLARIRSHLENREPLDVRCRITGRTGAILYCRLRGQAERDAAGRPARLAGSISDISEQIRAEEALTRSQDFYGTILDSLPLFISYADREQRVRYANRPFQQFFAAQPQPPNAVRSLSDILGSRRYEAIRPFVQSALEGHTAESHGRFRDGSGRPIEMEAIFVPHLDEHGVIQGCFVAARDVTEKRLLEAELRQSQKMEAIGRLTGGIAHDFNNLLSVIIGNAQLLSRSLRESPRLLRQAETTLKAAVRGAELTRRLLAFARQQVLEPRVVDINSLLSGMYELLRRSLTGEIEIQQRLEREPWPLKVDPGQLENAVLNLVINARDAMPDGGVIDITTRNVAISDVRNACEDQPGPGEYLLLEVRDTGSGMSPQVLKRVFEPFFTTKETGKGSGLGLAMVYGFVKQSDGYVHISSAAGAGTTVHLYFPRTHAAVQSASLEPAAILDLPRGSETILVVEDDLEVRSTATDILTSLGYRVLQAGNGHQALEQFMQHPDIALVFSDVMLSGGLLGTNLVTKLRERRPSLSVLLTTGFSESLILHRGLMQESVTVLSKPYKVEDLARRIRAILDGNEETRRVQA
jgi:PAS domain S-box-containing protein